MKLLRQFLAVGTASLATLVFTIYALLAWGAVALDPETFTLDDFVADSGDDSDDDDWTGYGW